MRFLTVLSLLLVMVFAGTRAQCPRDSRNPNCDGGRNEGCGGSGCNPGARWYFDPRTRTCEAMQYRGCGDTTNRCCRLVTCQRRCPVRSC